MAYELSLVSNCSPDYKAEAEARRKKVAEEIDEIVKESRAGIPADTSNSKEDKNGTPQAYKSKRFLLFGFYNHGYGCPTFGALDELRFASDSLEEVKTVQNSKAFDYAYSVIVDLKDGTLLKTNTYGETSFEQSAMLQGLVLDKYKEVLTAKLKTEKIAELISVMRDAGFPDKDFAAILLSLFTKDEIRAAGNLLDPKN